MNHDRIYSLIARIWGWVFISVGLAFLFIPQNVASILTVLSSTTGLSGTIVAPASNLWHVLSLSLMSMLAVAIFASAKTPENNSLYHAILTAKTVSTLGFVLLSLQESAWLVCAAGDGFVALTLIWARRTRHTHHYEIWFGKLNFAPQQAFWFRHTVFHGVKKEVANWAILFCQNQIQTGKDILPPNLTKLQNLLPGDASTTGKAGKLSWDLKWRDSGKQHDFVPWFFKILGLAKSHYQSRFADVHFQGTIKTPETNFTVHDAPGMLGHIQGKSQAHEWAWMHCNDFDTAGPVKIVIEGLSARLKFLGFASPVLSTFVIWINDLKYDFRIFGIESDFAEGRWNFFMKKKNISVSGKITLANATQVATVEYDDTDGTKLWCRNTKLANLSLHVKIPQQGLDQTFFSHGTTAFEVVNRHQPSNICHS